MSRELDNTEPKSIEQVIEAGIKAPVMDSQDEARKQRLERLKKIRIRLAEDSPEPSFLITCNGVGTLSRGDIQAIKAKSKNGKSQLVSIFAAVALGAKFGGLAAVEKNLNVVLFDTEQNRRNVTKSGQKVHRLLGWDVKTDNPHFECYPLRTEELEQRYLEIVDYIREYKPDLAIVDGLADLTVDFNNQVEAQAVVGELMEVSEEVQCAIVFVLHENKSKDDSNMKGHLGTMAVQKCSDVFRVTKTGNTFKVEQTESRNAPVEPFSFTLDDNSTPQSTETVVEPSKEEVKRKELFELLQQVYGNNITLSHSRLKEGIMNESDASASTAKRRIDTAVKLKLIQHTAKNDGYVFLSNTEPSKI